MLHADLDAFYASVECRDDPSLRGRPMAVGGGVILSASYQARRFGVRSAMNERTARRLCPDLLVVPMRPKEYTKASRAVFDVFRDITPLVEGISIDEAFLDVSGLRRSVGPAEQVAQTLRERVWREVGLQISVGVARTKYLAKVASQEAKPNGLVVVPHEQEKEFLHPLPVERLWGVGPKTAERLHARGIATIGQLAAAAEQDLQSSLGQHAGRHLWALANLEDPRRVRTGRRRSSIGSQRAIGSRPRSAAEIDEILLGIVDRVMGRLRDGGRPATTITVRVRFGDFTRATRSRTLDRPTTSTETVVRISRELLGTLRGEVADRGLSLVGVTLSGLDTSGHQQLMLPFDAQQSGQLDTVLDEVRQKFGRSALSRGVHVGRSTGIEVPLLPDA